VIRRHYLCHRCDRIVFYLRFTSTHTRRDHAMFGLFKSNPTKKLRKQYDSLLERAMHAQRNGDIKTYSMLTAESETLWEKIQTLEEKKK